MLVKDFKVQNVQIFGLGFCIPDIWWQIGF